jgi:hypothetical protein
LNALGTFDSHAAQEIFLHSEGNPFYVEELAALWTTGQPRVPATSRPHCSLIWRPRTPRPGSTPSATPASSSNAPSSFGAGSLTRSGAQASLEPTC